MSTRRLNYILINKESIKDEVRAQIKKFLEMNEKKDTTCQKLLDSMKAVLRGKFIVLNAYIKKLEESQINELMTQGLGKRKIS